jgi:hypothetical protein
LPRWSYLDVVALVVVATLTEKPMVHNAVNVQLVEKRVAILIGISLAFNMSNGTLTLDTEAVKTTTSYSSPTRFIN